jgi:hypothetical protein
MGQLGKLLGDRILERAGQAKNTVAGVVELEQLRELTGNVLARVAGRAYDEDRRSHLGFADSGREQELNVRMAITKMIPAGSEMGSSNWLLNRRLIYTGSMKTITLFYNYKALTWKGGDVPSNQF